MAHVWRRSWKRMLEETAALQYLLEFASQRVGTHGLAALAGEYEPLV